MKPLLLAMALLDVSITVHPVIESNGTVSINGETNLPDGTRLVVDIWNASQELVCQRQATVSKGAISIAPMVGRDGRPFAAGEYRIYAVTLLPGLQPTEVQQVIGTRGEYLSGNLASSNLSYTIVGFTRLVSITHRSGSAISAAVGQAVGPIAPLPTRNRHVEPGAFTVAPDSKAPSIGGEL